jgi:hypothetical protein
MIGTQTRAGLYLVSFMIATLATARANAATDTPVSVDVSFFAALLTLILVGRLCGEAMNRIGQPSVIGQLLAGTKQGLELLEKICFGAKMAEMCVALPLHLCHLFFHLQSIVAMESVAFDDRASHSFTTKDFFEGSSHRGGAGTRGAGDDNYGMLFGQVSRLCTDRMKSPTTIGILLLSKNTLSPAHVRAYE